MPLQRGTPNMNGRTPFGALLPIFFGPQTKGCAKGIQHSSRTSVSSGSNFSIANKLHLIFVRIPLMIYIAVILEDHECLIS